MRVPVPRGGAVPSKPRCVAPQNLKWEANGLWLPSSELKLVLLDVQSTAGKSPFAVSLAMGVIGRRGCLESSFQEYVKVPAQPPAGRGIGRPPPPAPPRHPPAATPPATPTCHLSPTHHPPVTGRLQRPRVLL